MTPLRYVAKISGKMRHSTALEKRVQRHKRGERMTMMLSSPFLPWLWLSHTLQKAKSNQTRSNYLNLTTLSSCVEKEQKGLY